ncbi:hypothetical protein L1987_50922 [Smallanthus sonchifolius]|uniref:Uncharacterized protein n=1 Tax=Smallanthus sonchifolius TaxID=185202 RepID=A0ACB9EPZ6_9ASTR|nr:hypothetical protein L1987_50922 [Smallanthus sonchifolius]
MPGTFSPQAESYTHLMPEETRAKIETCSFPGAAYCPYRINPAEVDGFLKELQKIVMDKAAAVAAKKF